MLVVSIVVFFTVTNILVSAYMSYLTINLAINRCKCAVMNAYWFLIISYFLTSIVFLVYSMLVFFGRYKADKMTHFIVGYLICTIAFVAGSFAYTKYLTSNKCDCVTNQYRKFLEIITFVRLLMAVVTFVSLLLWGLYVVLQK